MKGQVHAHETISHSSAKFFPKAIFLKKRGFFDGKVATFNYCMLVVVCVCVCVCS
jgi:hypothetical protein